MARVHRHCSTSTACARTGGLERNVMLVRHFFKIQAPKGAELFLFKPSETSVYSNHHKSLIPSSWFI